MKPALRTNNYKRKNWTPYHSRDAKSSDEDRMNNLIQSVSKMNQQEIFDKNLNQLLVEGITIDDIKELFTQDKEKAKKFYATLDEYPNLNYVLDEIVNARLSLLNSDEQWANDKNYGWGIRDFSVPVIDEELKKHIANVKFDEKNKRLTYDELETFPDDEMEAAQLRKSIEDNFLYHLNEDPLLSPMTKEQAESYGYGWVPSTDEYINGLYATDPILRDYLDKELLYETLKRKFEHKLNNDTQYKRAREWRVSEPNLFEKQFELPSSVEKFAFQAVAPFSAGALFDDELSFKTSPTERVLRGVGDFGLGVASYALPFGLARLGLTQLGGRALSKIPQLSKIKSQLIKSRADLPSFTKNYGTRRLFSEVPQIFGGVSDGVIGGLADYGLQRGVDQGFMTVYGDGAQSIHQPITAVDLASFGLLGGLLGAGRKYGTGRAYDDMKAKMNKGDPTKVSKKEVDDYLELSDKGVNRDAVKREWEWKAFDDYEQKYPNGGREVKKPPMPEIYDVDIDPTKKLPLLQINDTDLKKKLKEGYIVENNILYKVAESGKDDVAEQGKRIMQEAMGMEADDIVERIPVGYVEPDDMFIGQYVKQNEGYYGDLIKNHALAGKGDDYVIDNIGLKDALVNWQNPRNLEATLFDGESKILPDKLFKEQKNIATGSPNNGNSKVFRQNQQGKDDFYGKILSDRSEVGTIDEFGRFNPATKEQLKDFEVANNKRRERRKMTDFTRDDFEKARKKYSSRYTKTMVIPFGIAHGIYNNHPFSRTIGDVPSYEYISPINTEDEDK